MAETTTLSKLEYLKKYMSSSKNEELKKKKKKLKAKVGVRIVDEEIDLKKIKAGYEVDDDHLETQEDAPQVAAIIDERSDELRTKQDFVESSKWKRLDSGGSESSKTRTHHDSDSDRSPPRKLNPSVTKGTSSDANPPQIKRTSKSLSCSSNTRTRHDSDSDHSPPRLKGHSKADTNLSSSRPSNARTRHDSDSDASPPRQKSRSSKSESHPSSSRSSNTRARHDSDSDLSPARHKSQSKGDTHPSSSRSSNARIRRDSDSDASPSRQKIRGSSSKAGSTSKPSGSKARRPSEPMKIKEEPDSDASPPRRRIKEEPDASPPRRKRPVDSDGDLSPVRTKAKTTLSGKVAGLQTGRALRQEAEVLRKKEDEAFGRLDRELTGENARTQVRAAKLADMEAKVALNRQKQEKLQMLKEATDKWSKGVKQDRDRAERVAEAAHEMAKPLARFAGDDDLEQHLRAVERDGDPMAQFLAKKKAKNQPSRPVYRGPAAAPNRFGILPGYRWDGVDRSNGYEKKYFEKHNKTLAVSEEAYKWSVSDM